MGVEAQVLVLITETFIFCDISRKENTKTQKKRKSMILNIAQCLKITEKVSFNIASYVYILSGQKLIKNAKNGPIRRVFENLKLAVKQCYQTGQF